MGSVEEPDDGARGSDGKYEEEEDKGDPEATRAAEAAAAAGLGGGAVDGTRGAVELGFGGGEGGIGRGFGRWVDSVCHLFSVLSSSWAC